MLVLLLQVALIIVLLLVVWELLRLRRFALLSQLSMASLQKARVAQSIREAEEEARARAGAVGRLEDTAIEEPEPEPTDEPAGDTEEAPEAVHRRGPRVLSEAGRAKYDRVLQLAAQGMDIDSIAGVVDLTRAEVELMLGSTE